MGLFKPSVKKLYDRGDIRGLLEAIDVSGSSQRAVDATFALSIIGEPALPFLMPEIAQPPDVPGYFVPLGARRMYARMAVEKMGDVAVPHLLAAIVEGDSLLAEGALDCLFSIGAGGAALADGRVTQPCQIDYSPDVRAAYEQKVGRRLDDDLGRLRDMNAVAEAFLRDEADT